MMCACHLCGVIVAIPVPVEIIDEFGMSSSVPVHLRFWGGLSLTLILEHSDWLPGQ